MYRIGCNHEDEEEDEEKEEIKEPEKCRCGCCVENPDIPSFGCKMSPCLSTHAQGIVMVLDFIAKS